MEHTPKILILVSLLFTSVLFSQENYQEIESWEPDEITPIYLKHEDENYFEIQPGKLFAFQLIKLYQHKIATQSVSRCPFYISCSNYAFQAIEKHGLIIGVCYFIDRHFYRENISSFYHYSLRETDDGILKLDDSFYLHGGNYSHIKNE